MTPTLAEKTKKAELAVEKAQAVVQHGMVTKVTGIVIEATGPALRIGDQVTINSSLGEKAGEVVGFSHGRIFIMPLGDMAGIGPGAKVIAAGRRLSVRVGPELLGRVVDGLGKTIDGLPEPDCRDIRTLDNDSPPPLKRKRITQPFETGIRAIDGFLLCGLGQRVAILSGSGVGKSVLLGMIARSSAADVNVIGLIGERGREVREFMERDLGPEGLAKSIVVVVTSDNAPLLRIKGVILATAIAEYFRDQGKNVALMVDSLTRVAMGQREIGLSIGEPPTTRGYVPSVFALLPKILERAGQSEKGSITAFYTVLVEGDDFSEPISDAVKAIVDGHIVLSRQLASKYHYPAIDVLESISRLMPDIAAKDHLELAGRCREILADYRDAEDLINIGAYVKGSSPKIDYAIERIEPLRSFLKQKIDEKSSLDKTLGWLGEIQAGVQK